jgi:STE24 endopeptidase
MAIDTAVPTYRRIDADPSAFFEADEVKKAKDYQRPLTVARAISFALNLGLLLVVISTHAAPKLIDALGSSSWVVQLVVVFAAMLGVFAVIDLPVSTWVEFSHEKRWGFSTQTPGRYVGDFFKGLILGTVIQAPLVLALYWLMRTTDLWWLFGWAVFFAFSIVLALLFPIVIMPLFNKFTPLGDEELALRLQNLAESVGMKVKGVQVMDASKRTKKDNAFFAGLGRTRRVVVFDNLLAQPHAVIASVVGHELGHWRRRHVAWSIALGTITSLLLFFALKVVTGWEPILDWAGVSDVSDPGSIPVVVLIFSGVSSLTGLLQAWVSRAHERQADLDALEITQDYDAFVETEHGLSTRNLIDLAPSWLRYVRASHPPPAERLRLAELWRDAQASATTRSR